MEISQVFPFAFLMGIGKLQILHLSCRLVHSIQYRIVKLPLELIST